MNDTISRQAAIDVCHNWDDGKDAYAYGYMIEERLQKLPSEHPEPIKINIDDFNKEDWERFKKEWGNTPITVLPAQLEPLTDKEQRIFLAAMGREEKVCEEVDRNYVREPYEDSLVRVCKEIRRKVKGALWT